MDEELKPIKIPDKLEDLILLESVDLARKKMDTYTFNNIPVPRVSNILKECISKEFLMNWAAKLGKQYYYEKVKATSIGTYVHEMIEYYMLNGTDLDIWYKIADPYKRYVATAYNNFKDWYNNLISRGYTIKVIATEVSFGCPYYGGTIDLIAEINGATYIIDYKTSKQISFEYIIQTCAYKWAADNGYVKGVNHIDGIGIIRVDKEKVKYEDLFLNEFIAEQKRIIDWYTTGFGSLLYSYYNIINMKQLFTDYKKEYNFISTIGEIYDEKK